MTPLFLSRSAIEDYQDCQALYWWRYQAHRRGIVPEKPVRALEMGTAVHLGMEILMSSYLPNEIQEKVDMRIWLAIDGHLRKTFFSSTPEELWNLDRDVCLCYALVLTFAYQVLPSWGDHPWFIERDVAVEVDGATFESKSDYVGWNPNEGRFKLYNWKTAKYHPLKDGRADKQFKHDLQGITESICIETAVKKDAKKMEEAAKALAHPILAQAGKIEKIRQNQMKLAERMGEFKIDSVSYVFFVKGDERQEKDYNDAPTGRILNYSPLVRGYRTRAGGEFQYAWVDKVVKEENRSGFGKLGKGWEEFEVWEDESLGESKKERMDRWLEILRGGLQEEIGNPLAEAVVMTGEKFRNEGDNKTTWEYEVYWTIEEIQGKLNSWQLGGRPLTFTRNRGACSYPSECPYKDGCFRGLSPEDLLGNGFKEREPHHEKEREYWEGVERVEREGGGEGEKVFGLWPKYD